MEIFFHDLSLLFLTLFALKKGKTEVKKSKTALFAIKLKVEDGKLLTLIMIINFHENWSIWKGARRGRTMRG